MGVRGVVLQTLFPREAFGSWEGVVWAAVSIVQQKAEHSQKGKRTGFKKKAGYLVRTNWSSRTLFA